MPASSRVGCPEGEDEPADTSFSVNIPARTLLRAGKRVLGVCVVALGLACLLGGRFGAQGGGALLELPWSSPKTDRRLAAVVTTAPSSEHGAVTTTAVTSGCDGAAGYVSGAPIVPHSLNSMLSAVLMGYLITAALDHVNYLVPESIRFPISCIIFLVGCIVDLLMKEGLDNLGDTPLEVFFHGRNSLSYFDPHAIFFVILPPLLFESASGMSWHVLKKVLPSSLILALPGVLINVCLTGVICKWFITDTAGHTLSWEAIFLLSSILSATDPVAVVAALRSLGAPAKLSSLIEGESLLNDGSAFVVFLVFQDWVGKTAPNDEKLCAGTSPSAGCIIGKFFQLALGGSLLGILTGMIVKWWIRHARFLHAATLELTIVLLGVWGSFFVAETLHCSGVLAVVVYGIFMAATIWPLLSHEARHANHMVLATISYLCDKIIFFVAGMVSMRFIREPARCAAGGGGGIGPMVGNLILLYIILHITRSLVVLVFAPILTRLGYGMSFKEGSILVFGGLRGALGLAMGLIVEHNHYIDPETSSAIAFYTSGIVFLTLVINGSTVDNVYKSLKLYPANQYRIRYLRKQLQKVEKECKHVSTEKLKGHWFFKDCDFDEIAKCVPNFCNVEFDDCNGRPRATGLVPVGQALKDLEHQANRHMRNQLIRKGLNPKSPDDFESAWRDQHKDTAQYVAQWLQEAVHQASSCSCGAGDLMENVLDYDDGVLEFRRLGGTEVATPNGGIFVSRRSLARVSERQPVLDSMRRKGAEASFSLVMSEMGKERVVVGLTANVPTGCEDLVESTGDGEGVLGRMPFSVGLDTSTCRIVYNTGDQEPIVLQTVWEATGEVLIYSSCSRGSCVIGKKHSRDILRGFQVGLWIQLIGEPGYVSLLHQSRGRALTVPPSMLGAAAKAAVAAAADTSEAHSPMHGEGSVMIPSPSDAGPSRSLRFSKAASFIDDDRPGDVDDQLAVILATPKAHSGRPALRPVDVSHEDAGPEARRSLSPGDMVRVKVHRTKGQPWRISFLVHWKDSHSDPELVGVLCLGEYPPDELHPSVEFIPPGGVHSVSEAFHRATAHLTDSVSTKVKLSFHPEVVDEHDSLHEVFVTLFNTVSYHYRRQHEDGVIGHKSLRWLLEAASDALDCANRDKHATQVLDFKHIDRTVELEEAVAATMQEKTPATFQRARTQKSLKGMTNHGAPVTNPFSPIIVEYLSIERHCQKASWFDKYPRAWKFEELVRSFGYVHTNAKVECLCAFIEAHEHVLEEFTMLERFSALRDCLEHVLGAAKRDLRLIQDLNARRFYYSKHTLLLKIVISRRMRILEEQSEEGWIAPSDADPLLALTRELLAEIETHRPKAKMQFRLNSRESGSGRLGSASSLSLGDAEAKGAWSQSLSRTRSFVKEISTSPRAKLPTSLPSTRPDGGMHEVDTHDSPGDVSPCSAGERRSDRSGTDDSDRREAVPIFDDGKDSRCQDEVSGSAPALPGAVCGDASASAP